MFNKDKDKKEAQQKKDQAEENKTKTKEQSAQEAKDARAQDSSIAQKSEVEKSFGDDQNHRYDPQTLEKAQAKKKASGESPETVQEVKLDGDSADVQGVAQGEADREKLNADINSKDYSKDIQFNSLVYLKPKNLPVGASPSSTDGRPWTVLQVFDDKAKCLIQDPATNMQKTEVFKLSDLSLDEPK